MAIINSIVMGKSRGKIGNVVTCTLKGQVVAKSRNYAPSNPKTTLQTNSRAKMSNAVMAWQFLVTFMAYAFAIRKPLESTYNAFVRLTKNYFSDVIAASGAVAMLDFGGQEIGLGNYSIIGETSLVGTNLTVPFETGGVPFIQGSKVRNITFISATGQNVIVDRAVTEIEWNAGSLVLAGCLAASDVSLTYIYETLNNKISNIKFNQL